MTKDELNLSATNFGFDPTWVADILLKHGEAALKLAVEAARNGFSISLVIEILQKFGPALLQLLVDVFVKKQAAMRMGEGTGVIVPGDVVQGDGILGVDASLLNVIIEKYLPMILEKYAPAIWTTFGPIIVQFVESNLQTILDKFGPQLMQWILQSFLSKAQNKM